MTTYEKTVAYMFDCLPMFHRIGAAAYKANLDNTLALSKLCGKPELDFPSIHIAGTNGKGSVSHMMASIMQEQGLKTGLYTSPHLKDFRERIRVNGKMIPKHQVVQFVNQHKKDFETILPSFFEITFAMAMEYFSEQKVDIAIVETGMGGRLDSTNIVSPVITVITNIGYDHTQFLGDTLPKIAAEKAGIIKPGIPVIIGKTQAETKTVFTETASKNNSKIIFADTLLHLENFRFVQEPPFGSISNIRFSEKPFLNEVYCALSGIYQQENMKTVIAACLELAERGYPIDEKTLRKGLKNVVKNTGLQGRWQVLSTKPLTICDTGHNKDGLTQVIRHINLIKHNNLHFVFGLVSDKDVAAILGLLPADATYYFCKPDIPRGLDVTTLLKEAEKQGLKGKSFDSVGQALKSAQNAAKENDLVFVGGSTFVVAEIL